MAAAEETDSAELILITQFFQSPLEEELRGLFLFLFLFLST